ncbi:MAG: hypothetical protein GX855_05560, partial [Firmicutes bacterium]|nr:hypothetical protein [Bacillota bacterium]
FWFGVEPEEYLSYDEGRVLAMGRYVRDNTVQQGFVQSPYDKPRMRAFMDIKGRGHARPMPCVMGSSDSHVRVGAILYEVELKGREAHVIDVTIPFETYTEASQQDVVARLSFDVKMAEMVSYWRKVIDAGAKLEVPEQVINDFWKAVISHIAITADKDVDTGLYILPAATYRYNVCSNEACMQIHMLDLLGHHERARKYLETFLKCQGTRPLHGRFRTSEGVFHGLRVSDDLDYQTFNYNLDHGWVMYTCAEHYRLTGDRAWLEKWAPNLVAAADFVARERKATMRYENGEKVWEYGLLPAGHLEDNPEWFYWYSVNGYTWRGMQAVGEVLAEIGWPDAQRILNEAAAYKEDILAAVRRSRTLAPLVPLRDGTYIPHHPTRAYIRGRDLGWIRENLYGAMHLIQTGVIADDSQEATWILKDYEDNLFVNPAFGRFVDVEKDWFSQGGMTIQAHLLYVPLIYLRRNQIKHAVRAYFNAFASHLYPDVRCFTEHAVRQLGIGVGPFYKTPDEAGSVTWLRHLLVYEQGYLLRLGWGVPRYWLTHGKSVGVQEAPTHFGTISYTIESRVSEKIVEVRLTPPQRKKPQCIEIRIRHPEQAAIKTVSVSGSDSYEVDRHNECVRLLDWDNHVQLVVTYQ